MITSDIQEFCHNLGDFGLILGIDFGTKKLGIAISNPERTMSLPISIIPHEIHQIESTIKQYKPLGIVVGLPVNMDGTMGAQAELVRKFAQKLLCNFGLPIFLQDERLTTRAAGNALRVLGLNRKQRDERDDQVAAAMILETTLASIARWNSQEISGPA